MPPPVYTSEQELRASEVRAVTRAALPRKSQGFNSLISNLADRSSSEEDILFSLKELALVFQLTTDPREIMMLCKMIIDGGLRILEVCVENVCSEDVARHQSALSILSRLVDKSVNPKTQNVIQMLRCKEQNIAFLASRIFSKVPGVPVMACEVLAAAIRGVEDMNLLFCLTLEHIPPGEKIMTTATARLQFYRNCGKPALERAATSCLDALKSTLDKAKSSTYGMKALMAITRLQTARRRAVERRKYVEKLEATRAIQVQFRRKVLLAKMRRVVAEARAQRKAEMAAKIAVMESAKAKASAELAAKSAALAEKRAVSIALRNAARKAEQMAYEAKRIAAIKAKEEKEKVQELEERKKNEAERDAAEREAKALAKQAATIAQSMYGSTKSLKSLNIGTGGKLTATAQAADANLSSFKKTEEKRLSPEEEEERKKKEDERAAANEAAKAAGQKAAILSMNMYASTNSLSKAFKGATSGYVSPSTASPSMNRSASSLL